MSASSDHSVISVHNIYLEIPYFPITAGGCHEHWRGNKKGVPISWDALSWIRGLFGLKLARGLVRFVSQIKELIEKLLRLADEEPVIHETLKRGDGAAELNGCRANDGDRA